VDITNPQTWNRYAYVANNPLNAIDPLGLILCGTHESDPWCNGGGQGAGGGVTMAELHNTPWMGCLYRGRCLGSGSEAMASGFARQISPIVLLMQIIRLTETSGCLIRTVNLQAVGSKCLSDQRLTLCSVAKIATLRPSHA
jgi:hypothetical protein